MSDYDLRAAENIISLMEQVSRRGPNSPVKRHKRGKGLAVGQCFAKSSQFLTDAEAAQRTMLAWHSTHQDLKA